MPSDKTMSSLRPVSVVIPTKNAGQLFEEVLAALVVQQGVILDLVVVDSGSRDQTLAIAKKYGARITEIPLIPLIMAAPVTKGLRWPNKMSWF